MTELAARLDSLPSEIAEPMRRVLALAEQEPSEEFDIAVEEALLAAGFTPSSGKPRDRVIPLASELSPAQRTIAELLAALPEVWLMNWPLYCTPWLRRRWLGLEPGGVLFDLVALDVEGAPVRWPLIHALRHCFAAGQRERALGLIEALPLPSRVEALVGLQLLDDPDFNVHTVIELAHQTSAQLADAGSCPGAKALAEWASGLRDELPENIEMLLRAALACEGATDPRL